MSPTDLGMEAPKDCMDEASGQAGTTLSLHSHLLPSHSPCFMTLMSLVSLSTHLPPAPLPRAPLL